MTHTFADAAAMVAARRPAEPVYCLRPETLRAGAKAFVEAFPGEVLYAVKCNDDRRVLRALYEGGIRGFDVASLPELAQIHDQFGALPGHFMHPIKSRRAIAEAYFRYGVRSFALDHEDELAKILNETKGADDLTLVVRIEAPRNVAIWDLGGKFGAPTDLAADLLRAARRRARAVSVTWHVGSQCLAPSAYARAMDLAGIAIDRADVQIDLIDVGGGFPAEYIGAKPPPLADYFSEIVRARKAIGLDDRVRLLAEPGRALVAAGCSLVVRVELRRGDAVYLNDGLYGSLSDLKFEGIDFPMRAHRPDGPLSGRLVPFRLFGPTCDSTDSMPGPYWLPDDLAEGDWIEFGQMGAYTNTLRTRFNGLHPNEFVFVKDAAFLPMPEMMPRTFAPRIVAAA